MNGRAPKYRKCNEITLINPATREFKTFWKNAHQQFLISEGKFYGLTYEAGNGELVDKESGNAEYIRLRKEGWMKWQDYCREKSLCISDYGYRLI